jgi:ferredoxin-NADP reductase
VRNELDRLEGDGPRRAHADAVAAARLTGPARRVDAQMRSQVGPSPAARPHAYVWGPTPFVESVAEALVQLGHEPHGVKTERFGPTGG